MLLAEKHLRLLSDIDERRLAMAFHCPDCRSNMLQIQDVLELPSDADHDEITLQTVVCERCGLRALALYTESRRGALDSEAWRHDGYRVSREDFERVHQRISACPTPRDAACRCETHADLGRQHEGRWAGLRASGLTVQDVFRMQWADE